MKEYRCKKCGSSRMIPTPESNYQKYKCLTCGEIWNIVYEKKYTTDGYWGTGIG